VTRKNSELQVASRLLDDRDKQWALDSMSIARW